MKKCRVIFLWAIFVLYVGCTPAESDRLDSSSYWKVTSRVGVNPCGLSNPTLSDLFIKREDTSFWIEIYEGNPTIPSSEIFYHFEGVYDPDSKTFAVSYILHGASFIWLGRYVDDSNMTGTLAYSKDGCSVDTDWNATLLQEWSYPAFVDK